MVMTELDVDNPKEGIPVGGLALLLVVSKSLLVSSPRLALLEEYTFMVIYAFQFAVAPVWFYSIGNGLVVTMVVGLTV